MKKIKEKVIKAKPKEIEMEFGKFKITAKADTSELINGQNINFTIDGKNYYDVIGPVSHMNIDIGTFGEPVIIKLTVYPKVKDNTNHKTDFRR